MQLKVEMFWKAGAQAKKGRDRFFLVIRKMLRILNYGLFLIARKSLELQGPCYQMSKKLNSS